MSKFVTGLVAILMASLAGCMEQAAVDNADEPEIGPVLVPTLVLEDAVDVSGRPCSAAIDLRELSATWGNDAVHLNLTYSDLSVLTDPEALVHDGRGSCFWSHTDFVAEFNQTFADTIYMDHNRNPQYATGWRMYLDGGGSLEGVVTGNTIHIPLPFSIIGEPTVGDRFGGLRHQTSNSFAGVGFDYQTDWYPNDTNACDCWLNYNHTA